MALVSNSRSQHTGPGIDQEPEAHVPSTTDASPIYPQRGAPTFSDVIENLRGQIIKFDPNYLVSIFRTWPRGQNKHLEKLRQDIYQDLARLVS